MSHYTVGVIAKKELVDQFGIEGAVNKMLEPFDENMEVAPYPAATIEQVQEKYNTLKEVIACGESKIYNVDYLKTLAKDGRFDSLESFIEHEYNDYDEDVKRDEHGIPYVTYNPNSKWDWYCVGGRWSGLIKDDHCLIKDLELRKNATEESIAKMTAYYNAITKEQSLWDDTDKEATKNEFIMYKPEHYKEKFPTLDEYIDYSLSFSTYAILTSDGKWIEPGKMGWFGASCASAADEGKFYKVIAEIVREANPDDTFIVVDCHI